MELTSIRRVRAFVVGQGSTPLTTTTDNDRTLRMWISSVSRMIEKFLCREIYSKQYTENYSLTNGRTRFWVKAPPVTSICSVCEDPESLWCGNESEIDDCFTDEYGASINLPYQLNYTGVNVIQAIYSGGLALHAVNSVYGVDSGDSFTAGKYVIGNTTGAVGVVVSQTGALVTIEDYYGEFELRETLTEYEEETGTTATGVTSTLNSISSESLLRAYPDIVMGTECQIRFMWKHSIDFENNGTVQDGSTLRRSNISEMPLPLQRETIELIQAYKRTAL